MESWIYMLKQFTRYLFLVELIIKIPKKHQDGINILKNLKVF